MTDSDKIPAQSAKSNSPSFSANLKQIGVSVAISILVLCNGVNLSFTAIVLPQLTDSSSPDYMDTKDVSLYTSMLAIGCLFGSIFCSLLLNRFGHKITILVAIPITICGWCISYFSQSNSLHLASRFINGVYVSFADACSATYIAETADAKFRGNILAITDLAKQVGFLFVFLVGSSSLNWRTVGLVCGLLPLTVPFVVIFFLPDSPRWLAVNGYNDQHIINSLTFYRGEKCNVRGELEDIKNDAKNLENQPTVLNQLRSLIKKPLYKRVLLLAFLNFAYPLTGTSIVISYSGSIFQAATPDISPFTSTVYLGVISLFGTIVYIIVADRVGRRLMSKIFFFLCSFSTISLGIYFYLLKSHDVSAIFWLPLFSMLLFTLSSSLCLPVIKTLRSELMPNSVRGLGVNLMVFISSLSSYLNILTFPFIGENIGNEWAFWMYSGVSILIVVVIYFFLSETKGKSLEDLTSINAIQTNILSCRDL